MFKLLMGHTELKCLFWTLPEFSKLVVDGCVNRPEVWRIVLRVKIFSKTFYIPVCGIRD